MKMYHQQQNQHLIIQKLIILSKLKTFMLPQIVEEIRRERERKVLQKRRFKKALQQSVKNIKTKSKMQYN